MVSQPGTIGTAKETYVQFKGEEEEWEGFKTRLLAIAEKRGWKEALTSHDATNADDVKQNAEAKNYLAFALIGEAFVYFQTGELAMDVWTELCASYDKKESEDLLELMKKFDTYECDIGKKPRVWYLELKRISKQITMAGGTRTDADLTA